MLVCACLPLLRLPPWTTTEPMWATARRLAVACTSSNTALAAHLVGALATWTAPQRSPTLPQTCTPGAAAATPTGTLPMAAASLRRAHIYSSSNPADIHSSRCLPTHRLLSGRSACTAQVRLPPNPCWTTTVARLYSPALPLQRSAPTDWVWESWATSLGWRKRGTAVLVLESSGGGWGVCLRSD